MPIFHYKVKKGLDKIETGTITAESKESAVEKLIGFGFTPIKVELVNDIITGKNKLKIFFTHYRGITNVDLNIFTRQMYSLVKSKVEILRSLRIIFEQTPKDKMKKLIEDLHDTVKDGKTFSQALSKHPEYFSSLYISLIKVDELSGRLDLALEQLDKFADKEEEMRARIKAALVYPMLMMITGIASIIFLVTFVIPKLQVVFEDLGQSLPFLTRSLLTCSKWAADYWYWLILAFFAAIFLLKGITAGKNKILFDRLKLKIPLISNLVVEQAVSRFTRAFALLLKNGISMFEALKLSIPTLNNELLIQELDRVREDVVNGKSLSMSLKKVTYFSPFLVSMISVGEEGGRLDEVLANIAADYERHIDTIIKAITALIEPAIILILGLVVGVIVMAMLLPVFQMNMLAGV
ncbi:MAG: type II secretion system F family protein [Candidatus Omnitrophota bacterium]